MPVIYASLYGMTLGLLSGLVIALLFNLNASDAAFRMLVLAIGGGWIGMLLAWLNSLLPQPTGEETEMDRQRQT